MKGSRVQNVVQELRGEKIDIIPWHLDPAKFVCNALAPAEISRVIIDEDNRSMEVIVPDEYLSIAIGKKGQNVRLASKLAGWHLDVKNETRYSQAMQIGYDSLVALPGVGIGLADITTQRLVDKIDYGATYKNCITGISLEKAAVPMHFETDRQAIEVGLGSMGLIPPEKSKIVRIKNTNQLEMVQVSDVFADELQHRSDLEVLGEPRSMEFKGDDNLLDL